MRRRLVTGVCVVPVVAVVIVGGAVALGRVHLAFVRSGSMRPTIPVGALAVYVPTGADELHVGDVIAFRPPGRGDVVTHRIVGIERRDGRRSFVTQGDANGAPDPWKVPEHGTGWRYVGAVPFVGFLTGYLATDLARLLVVAALAGLLLRELWRPRPVLERVS